ncbi:hypothetical protein ABW19_dt0207219 [Dactylella cylindrospora]|nr:hypothetical protein ABW19_dt0207219 [Dactylella cylindrospora]
MLSTTIRRLPTTLSRVSTTTNPSLPTLRTFSSAKPSSPFRNIAATSFGPRPVRADRSNGHGPTSLSQVRGMKVRSAVKKLCSGCKSVRRKGYVYIICSKNQKHKQRQG